MFVRCKKRFKDCKEHCYWSEVENCRVRGGRVVQRQVLYLGEINDSQRAAWCPATALSGSVSSRGMIVPISFVRFSSRLAPALMPTFLPWWAPVSWSTMPSTCVWRPSSSMAPLPSPIRRESGEAGSEPRVRKQGQSLGRERETTLERIRPA